MQSMTGYGRGDRLIDGRHLTIELKSVNHRFLDLSFRMPRNLMFMEDEMRRQIGSVLSRGHVDVYVTYKNLREDAHMVTVDKALFTAYANALAELTDVGLTDDRSLMRVAQLPDVMTVTDTEEDREALQVLMHEVLGEALEGMEKMRIREGLSMLEDLNHRVDIIEQKTNEIEQRYPKTVEEYTLRLRQQIEELIGQSADETRVLTEVAVMADRSAIAEETVRLHSHVQQLRECFASAQPVGRRLDFLVQELNREVNTISSKSQDIPITRLCVDCKGEIEKLREQLQNVE